MTNRSRRVRRSLTGIGVVDRGLLPVLAVLSQPAVQAATITVDSASDGLSPTACTLRSAIEAANQDAPVLGCPAGAGVDEIEFAREVQGERVTLQSGPLTISSSLSINAAGSSFVVSGNDDSPVLEVSGAGSQTVTLTNLTLRDGRADGSGGAVLNSENLTLNRCQVLNSYATDNAGGIRNLGNLTLLNSAVSGNVAGGGSGGGIQSSGSLVLTDIEITNNTATGIGGGLLQFSDSINIEGGSVSGNSAASGGGMALSLSIGEISSVTVIGNSASGDGGGMLGQLCEITLTNLTLSGNSSGGDGGGASLYDCYTANFSTSTITGNLALGNGGGLDTSGSSGELEIDDTVIANNVAQSGGGGGLRLTDHDAQVVRSSLNENIAYAAGGAVLAEASAAITVQASTLSANTGGLSSAVGLYDGASLSLSNSTVSGNTGSWALQASTGTTATLRHVTLAQNTITDPDQGVIGLNGDVCLYNSALSTGAANCAGSGTLSTSISSAFGDFSCSFADEIDARVVDIQVGALSSNGGPTSTHLPLPGSPLIEAADLAECELDDQTGMPRPIDGNADGASDCDIGAVEYVDVTGPRAELASAPDVGEGGGTVYTVTVNFQDADAPLDLTSFDTGDVTVLPGPMPVTGIAVSGDAELASVQYTLTPPGGTWDAVDNGQYSIALVADEVFDTASTGANASPARTLGGWQVAVGEIDVAGNGLSIPSGSTATALANGTDFGQVVVGGNVIQSFTIANVALGQIEIQGQVLAAGEGFSISAQPMESSLGPGQNTSFRVSFTPLSPGPASATVSIASNDGDEDPYSFRLSGEGIALVDHIFADSFE